MRIKWIAAPIIKKAEQAVCSEVDKLWLRFLAEEVGLGGGTAEGGFLARNSPIAFIKA